MTRSAAAVVACALALAWPAHAAQSANHAPEPPVIDCASVRQAVAEHGVVRSIEWARRNGFSWRQIAAARKCLKG